MQVSQSVQNAGQNENQVEDAEMNIQFNNPWQVCSNHSDHCCEPSGD